MLVGIANTSIPGILGRPGEAERTPELSATHWLKALAGWEFSPSCQCGSWGNTPSDCKTTGWVMGNGVPRRNFTFWLLKLSLASRSNADEC